MNTKATIYDKRIENFDCGTDTKTIQSEKDNCDVNLIVSTYGKTGQFAHINPRTPTYGDFTGPTDLFEARKLFQEAEAAFMELPAEVRKMANNDPVTFLEMMADEGAVKALKAAGLPVVEPAKTDTPPVANGQSDQ